MYGLFENVIAEIRDEVCKIIYGKINDKSPNISTNKYIVVSAKDEQLIIEFLKLKNIRYNSEKTPIEIINSELDEEAKRELKRYLTYEKSQDGIFVELYSKIFNSKPDKSYNDYEYKYTEYRYIDNCLLELLFEKDLGEILLEPCNYTGNIS